ncbi:MAG TPA: response regulator [Methylomirabilota bacterium]|jgi:CheY-like chemotaxis protein|nr:response regulator [Methylomirabilota bacterium]
MAVTPARAPQVIMVIEDDTDTRQALGEYLKTVFPEARIVMSESGEAGLELAGHTRPRVIVLDLRLRGIGGFEFAERLRDQDGADGVAIVALTGDMSPDTLMKAEAAGFKAFLRKPADMDRLEMVLRPLLQDD